ncbi:MAG: hypothetical protein IJU29_02375 [Oscillospiraceae bacterium]|nr:hypothetical protein [Oscillospiraceae bacterium]
MSANQDWRDACDALRTAVVSLGFPEELAVAISKNLGWPKAMRRMTSWLYDVKPGRAELVVDEMLAIREEILTWKAKKASQETNMAYNELLNYGLESDEDR